MLSRLRLWFHDSPAVRAPANRHVSQRGFACDALLRSNYSVTAKKLWEHMRVPASFVRRAFFVHANDAKPGLLALRSLCSEPHLPARVPLDQPDMANPSIAVATAQERDDLWENCNAMADLERCAGREQGTRASDEEWVVL